MGITEFHSLMRYFIIAVALWTVLQLGFGLLAAKSGNRTFRPADRRPGLVFLILMDIQLLLGLALYFVYSPYGMNTIRNFGFENAMHSDGPRFFLVEHEIGMLTALVLVHIAYFITKKKDLPDQTKFSRAFWLFLIALLFILTFIPWPFRQSLGVSGWI